MHGPTWQTEVDHSVKQVPFSCHTIQNLVQELRREKQRAFVFLDGSFCEQHSKSVLWSSMAGSQWVLQGHLLCCWTAR